MSASSFPARSAKIVGIIGAKGGVGTTTVAWSFAADVAQQTGDKVLICDFDFDMGMIAFLAGVSAEHSIQDAIAGFTVGSFWIWGGRTEMPCCCARQLTNYCW